MIKKQILKNFISAWLSKFVKLFSAIYMVPVFINSMGKEAYGLIILLTTILSFAVLADIGIRSSITRLLAKANSLNEKDTYNKVLNTGLGIYLIIWSVLSFGLYFSSPYLVRIFNIPEIYIQNCILLLRTYGILSLLCSFLTPLFSAVSSSSNRFDLINYRDSITGLASLIMLIVAVKIFNISIIGWAVITLINQLFTLVLIIKIAYRVSPHLNISPKYFNTSIIREILQFGGIIFIGGWSRKMKIDADPLLISSVLGPSPIVLYRSGVAIPSQTRTLLGSFVGQITSVSTNLFTIGDNNRLAQLFERGTRLTLFMGIPVLVILVVFSYDIIEFWLGKSLTSNEILITSRCLMGMAIIDFCFYLEGSSYAILYGMNRLKYMTLTDLVLGILNICSSYFVLKYSGLDVWVVIVPTIILELIARPYYLYYTAKQIDYPRKNIFKYIYLPILIVLTPTLIVALTCNNYLPFNNYFKIILECLFTSIAYGITLWYVGFSSIDKNDFLSIIRKKKITNANSNNNYRSLQ